MEKHLKIANQLHFNERLSFGDQRIHQTSRVKEFHHQQNKLSQTSFFSTLPQHEDNGNQQWRGWETDSPSSPFQTQLKVHSLSSSQHSNPAPSLNIAVPQKKVVYHILTPDTTRTYENLDRSLKSNVILSPKVQTKSQNYLGSSREMFNSQKIQPGQSTRNLLKSKSDKIDQVNVFHLTNSLNTLKESEIFIQTEKKENYKSSPKSFKSDQLYQKKQEEEIPKSKDSLQYSNSETMYQTSIHQSSREAQHAFTLSEKMKLQERNRELQSKIEDLQKQSLSLKAAQKQWKRVSSEQKEEIGTLKESLIKQKAKRVDSNRREEIYENSVIQRISKQNMILLKQISQLKSSQIEQAKQLKQKHKSSQNEYISTIQKYQVNIQKLEKEKTNVKIQELVNIKNELDRYIAINKQLQKSLEEEKERFIDLKCKSEMEIQKQHEEIRKGQSQTSRKQDERQKLLCQNISKLQQQLQISKRESQSKVARLSTQLKQEQQNKQRLMAKQKSLLARIEVLEQQSKQKQKLLQSLNANRVQQTLEDKRQQKINELIEHLKVKQQQLKESQKVISDHQTQIHHLQQEKKRTQTTLSLEGSAQMSNLRQKNENLQKQSQKNLQEIGELRNRLNQIYATIVPLMTKLHLQSNRYEEMLLRTEENTRDVCDVVFYLQTQNEDLFNELKNSTKAGKFRNMEFKKMNEKVEKIRTESSAQSIIKSLQKDNLNLMKLIKQVETQKILLECKNNENFEMVKFLQAKMQQMQEQTNEELVTLKISNLNKKYQGL